MRLTLKQQQVIAGVLRKYFGAQAQVILFGSRVDDNARGGDIDLYVEPELTQVDDLLDAKLKALSELHCQLGEQKIDLVIHRPGADALPIYRVAQTTGVPL